MSSLRSVVSNDSFEIDSSRFTISRANRLATRDVHVYDFKNPDTVLGGLSLAQDITNASFYAMLIVFPAEVSSSQDSPHYILQTKDGTSIARDNNFLRPGTYYLNATGE